MSRFSGAILAAHSRAVLPLVADIKPYSPRDGDLIGKRRPADLAKALVDAGACALSVVTEPEHFGGSLQMLREVTAAASVPVLRKDFLKSPEQIDESFAAGAAAVLLILATTPRDRVPVLLERTRQLGIEAVIEVHTHEQLEFALTLSPRIVGINNRDILAFETDPGDVRVTEELAPLVPKGIVTISESSLRTSEEIERAIAAGAHAVLVGTAILQARDLTASLARLSGPAEAAGLKSNESDS